MEGPGCVAYSPDTRETYSEDSSGDVHTYSTVLYSTEHNKV